MSCNKVFSGRHIRFKIYQDFRNQKFRISNHVPSNLNFHDTDNFQISSKLKFKSPLAAASNAEQPPPQLLLLLLVLLFHLYLLSSPFPFFLFPSSSTANFPFFRPSPYKSTVRRDVAQTERDNSCPWCSLFYPCPFLLFRLRLATPPLPSSATPRSPP